MAYSSKIAEEEQTREQLMISPAERRVRILVQSFPEVKRPWFLWGPGLCVPVQASLAAPEE